MARTIFLKNDCDLKKSSRGSPYVAYHVSIAQTHSHLFLPYVLESLSDLPWLHSMTRTDMYVCILHAQMCVCLCTFHIYLRSLGFHVPNFNFHDYTPCKINVFARHIMCHDLLLQEHCDNLRDLWHGMWEPLTLIFPLTRVHSSTILMCDSTLGHNKTDRYMAGMSLIFAPRLIQLQGYHRVFCRLIYMHTMQSLHGVQVKNSHPDLNGLCFPCFTLQCSSVLRVYVPMQYIPDYKEVWYDGKVWALCM